MHWIVLDLEWNQPASYYSAAYRATGGRLLFEVIQFGAAKLDDQLRQVDHLSVMVHPTYYQSIHNHVRSMTGITREMLDDADLFPEAFERFMDWCGEDAAFLTWGADDISVLKQNMDMFGITRPLPKMYDIQRLYAAEKEKSGQTALHTAMEELGIEPDENRAFHNAEHDAYYTALVWCALSRPQRVLEFESEAKVLAHNGHRTRIRVTDVVPGVQTALDTTARAKLTCPTCGAACTLLDDWIPQAKGKYIGLCKCPRHGQLYVKAYFAALSDGRIGMSLSVLKLNHQNKAYAHTKLLQYQYKRSRGDYDHFDPEDLRDASGSNMPFEE